LWVVGDPPYVIERPRNHLGNGTMSRSKFYSPVDWDEIEKLRSEFKCASRTGSGIEGVELEIDAVPFVPVRVNGEGPFSMIFETGHRGYMLTDCIGAQFGLAQDDKRMVGLETFSIGDTCWHGMRFGLDDTGGLTSFLDRRIDGLLGNLFWMLQCVTPTLDYPGQRLYVSPTADAVPPNAYTDWVPMEILGFCPFVPVMINGQGPFRFHIDTGAGPCLLSEAAAKKIGLALGEPCTLRGTLINDPARHATVESLSVGGVEIHDLPVKVSLATLLIERNIKCNVDGAIGTSFLKHFAATFDYCGERFGLAGGCHRNLG
jgi:hypothetical protein